MQPSVTEFPLHIKVAERYVAFNKNRLSELMHRKYGSIKTNLEMKTHLFFILLSLIAINSYAQETPKTKDIDIIVSRINQSEYQVKKDTIIQDKPEYGLKMTTYLTMKVAANQLKKYENFVYTTLNQNGISREITTSTAFYYDQNKLIKVEEYMIEGSTKKVMNWYYSEDKPLYYDLKSEKAEDRAKMLLTVSEAMLKKVNP